MQITPLNLKKLIVGGVIIGLPLLTINATPVANDSQWYFKPFVAITYFFQNSYAAFSNGIQATTGLYLNLVDIKKNNRQLKAENTELKTRLNLLNEAQKEITRLNEMLDFKTQSKMKLLPSKVIGRDLLSNHATITINKGSNDGIKKNQGVINTDGVVGAIFRVSRSSSQVLLLTDRYSVVDAIVQRTRSHGVVEGVSLTSCQIRHIKRKDDILEDDLIVTGGLGNTFPKGLPIGQVKKVYTDNFGTSYTALIKPIINPSKMEELFVVLKTPLQPTIDLKATN